MQQARAGAKPIRGLGPGLQSWEQPETVRSAGELVLDPSLDQLKCAAERPFDQPFILAVELDRGVEAAVLLLLRRKQIEAPVAVCGRTGKPG